MDSLTGRVNLVLAFTLSWSLAIITIVNIEQYFVNHSPEVDLEIKRMVLRSGNDHDRHKKSDILEVKFDLDLDMTNVFDWNTWTVFMYLTAEYEAPDRSVNQLTFWDHIMTNKDDDFTLSLNNKRGEYKIVDLDNALLGHKNVSIFFHYNVIPIAGRAPDKVAGPKVVVQMPDEYANAGS